MFSFPLTNYTKLEETRPKLQLPFIEMVHRGHMTVSNLCMAVSNMCMAVSILCMTVSNLYMTVSNLCMTVSNLCTAGIVWVTTIQVLQEDVEATDT